MKQTSLNRVGGADETRKRKGELLQVGRFLGPKVKTGNGKE